ncbi:MAG: hypothetical protein LBC69_03890 [Eubacteriaceae bacterium]|jgi:hypothetical protein|nr:hypothetical protein [Eubacteriaceae bacterium]
MDRLIGLISSDLLAMLVFEACALAVADLFEAAFAVAFPMAAIRDGALFETVLLVLFSGALAAFAFAEAADFAVGAFGEEGGAFEAAFFVVGFAVFIAYLP